MPIYQPTEKVNLAEELGHSKPSAIETNKSKVFLNQSLEEKILHIWKDNIGIQDITTTDNFFHLGGTSLMAVRIFNQINESTGINASPILLLKHNTVESLSIALDSKSVSESWHCIYPFNEGSDLAPLFCFHSGEGHVIFYKDLAESIPDNRPVYGCLLYTSPSPRDATLSRMPSSA